ncbi:MAG: choice-of-anchor D domain-containing protein, partial [Bacteroidetes bacterium]|nr:choice-of-anchor D domain-containing protein [Bacteroidota bacterium]
LWSIVKPEITCSDLDMGSTCINKNKDSVIISYISNPGTYLLNIQSIKITGSDSSAFSIISGMPPFEVAQGGTKAVEFSFQPKLARQYTANVEINTLSDTIRKTITGTGVTQQISVINNLIDFGQIVIGSDSIITTYVIKNTGSAPINVISSNIIGPGSLFFYISKGNAPFTLQPGEEHQIEITFSANEIGRTNAFIQFVIPDDCGDSYVQLYGEGAKRNPKISANFPTIPNLICESYSISDLVISNTGGNPLIINSMTFKGNDFSDFIISETFPMTIEPDSSKRILITFSSSSVGQKVTDIEIRSNSEPDSLLTIQISARKDSVSIVPEIQTIDLGYFCLNETKDTILVVTNMGTISSGGYAIASSNIILSNNVFSLNIGDNHTINLHFNGSQNEGPFTENVIVIDSLCRYTMNVQVTGIVEVPIINADTLRLVSLMGKSKEGILTITNNRSRSVIIQNPPTISPPFEIAGNPFPLQISPNGTANITIQYTPTDTNEANLTLQFIGEPCNIIEETEISGRVAPASATIRIDSTSGYPGDTLNISILLINEQNLQDAGVTGFDADLSYNPSLLAPIDFSGSKIDESTASVHLTNLPPQTGEIAKVKFVVGLGNAETTTLNLSNLVVNGGTANVTVVSGSFHLLGICKEGGSRLLNPEGDVKLFSIKPNPSGEIVEIEMELIENGKTIIYLSNINGENIRTIFEGSPKPGLQKMQFSTKDLPTGTYLLILKTPTVIKSQKLKLIK